MAFSTKHHNRHYSAVRRHSVRYGMFVVIALAIVGIAGFIHADNKPPMGMLSVSSSNEQQEEAAQRADITADASPLTPESPASEPNVPLHSATQEETMPPSNKDQQPTGVPCKSTSNTLSREYTRQADKNLKSLNNRLAYPVVGSNISIEYIRTYNAEAAELYRLYEEKAANAGCSFPPSKPTVLPDSYRE